MLNTKNLKLSTIYCLLLLAGCASTGKSSDPTQISALEPAALLKFQDIPIPSAFRFVPEESYAFQNAGFRAGLLKYHGKASGDQIVVFFKEQMPLYNWSLINIVEHASRMLSFEKENETCVITVDEKGSKADIDISVAPKSQFAPRKAEASGLPSDRQSHKADKPIK